MEKLKRNIKDNWLVNKYAQFDQKNPRLNYYILYSVIFGMMAIIVYSWFYFYGKSFIWIEDGRDGLTQHYTAFAYYGKYLRSIIRGVLAGEGLNIPLWDFSIGYGADIITTLHYYVIGDPLTLLSVLAPVEKAEWMYSFVALLRIYLAGIAFSAYANKMKYSRISVLAGALSYAFCSYGLYAGIRHVFFANPMIYLPLLLLGVEKILRKEKPYLYIIMIFISAMSSFYFFYMLGIMVVLYAAIRFFALYKTERVRYFFRWITRFALYSVIGVLLAGVIFLPVIISVLSTQRFDIATAIDPFYDLYYYSGLLGFQVTASAAKNWSVIGHSSITLIALVLMFIRRKRYQQLKAALAIALVILLIPYLGHVMNGFSYVSNRWVFGYAFLMSLILCVMMKEILTMKKQEFAIVSIVLTVYVVISMLFPHVRSKAYLAAMMICAATLVYLILISYVMNESPASVKIKGRVLLCFLVMGIVAQAYYLFSPEEKNYVAEFQGRGTAYDDMKNTAASAAKKIDDDSFYRYEEANKNRSLYRDNAAILQEVNGTSYFFSLANENTGTFLHELAIKNQQGFRYFDVDKRIQLEILANVKYYVIDRAGGSKEEAPYGFEMIDDIDGYELYENMYALPFGYTYSEIIDPEVYEELTIVEKQQALMQGGYIEADIQLEKADIQTATEEISYQIEVEDGIELTDDKIIVRDTGGCIYISLDRAVEDCEMYLYIGNLHFDPMSPMERYTEEEREVLSTYEKTQKQKAEKWWQAPVRSTIKAQSNGVSNTRSVETSRYTWYSNQHEFLFNFEYQEEAQEKIKLTFEHAGEYSFEDITVLTQKLDELPEQVEVLREDVMENVIFDTDRVTGTIALDQSKILCMTIPYSEGWTAYVNGEEQEILQVNTMYSGLLLEAGDYEIELVYRTPGIKAGAMSTMVGVVLLIGIGVFYWQKRRNQKKVKEA